jgi:hypothetical protein
MWVEGICVFLSLLYCGYKFHNYRSIAIFFMPTVNLPEYYRINQVYLKDMKPVEKNYLLLFLCLVAKL